MPSSPTSFDEYIAQNPSLLLKSKHQQVADASAQKKFNIFASVPQQPQTPEQARAAAYMEAAARGAGVRDDAPRSVDENFAAAADPFLASRVYGGSDYMRDSTYQWGGAPAVGDVLLDGAATLIDIPGSIAAPVAGVFSADVGTAISEGTSFLSDGVRGLKTDGSRARARASQARGQALTEANHEQYLQDKLNGSSETVAQLSEIGRNAWDAGANVLSDRSTLSSVASQGVASLLAGGAISKFLGMAGGALANRAVAAFPSSRAAGALYSAAKGTAMPAAITMMESGGAYSQTTNEILGMSYDSLASSSPEYNQLIEQGLSPEEARSEIANAAGLYAASITAPIAAVTGKMVAPFEAAPFRVGSFGGMASNILKETAEESLQSGGSQIATNMGVQQYADVGRNVLQGVGEQIGIGALSGAGTAGLVQLPGAGQNVASAAMRGVTAGAKAAAKPILSAIEERFSAIEAEQAAASPVSPENVRVGVDQAMATAPDLTASVQDSINNSDATPEAKEQASSYMGSLIAAAQLSDEEINDPDLPENVRSALSGSKDRLDAILQLSDMVNEADTDSMSQLSAAFALHNNLNAIKDVLQQSSAGVIDELSDADSVRSLLGDFEAAIGQVQQIDKVKAAVAKIEKIVQDSLAQSPIQPIDAAQIDTPEGKQAVQQTLAVAELSPLNANPEANDNMLEHAEQGRIQLTNAQRLSLRASSALVQAQRERLAQVQKLGLATNNDLVSEDIMVSDTGEKRKQLSAASHLKRILAAARAGDTEIAAEYLWDFAAFAQHMQNKVDALNRHFNKGGQSDKDGESYKALSLSRGPNRPDSSNWIDAAKPLFVRRTSAPSIRTAQSIGADAAIITKLANDTIAAFPELGIQPIKGAPLNAQLMAGTAEQLAEAFKNGTNQAEVQADTPVDKQEAPTEQVDSQTETTVVEEQQDTPEPEDKGQPEGGDQSVETEVDTQPEPETEVVPDTQDDVVEPAPAPKDEPVAKGLDALFPKLLKTSWLKRAFKLSKQAKTRIIGSETPIAMLMNALNSSEDLNDLLGEDGKLKMAFNVDVAEAYQGFLEDAEMITKVMAANLKQVLAKKRGGQLLSDIVRDNLPITKTKVVEGEPDTYNGEDLTRFANFKALNIIDDVDGELVYNQELLETATLAALQWLLTQNNRQPKRDEKSVASILGMPANTLFEDAPIIQAFEQGMTILEAKRSLADKITQFMGLSVNAGAPQGQVEGIPEAIAGELMAAMVTSGILNVIEVVPADYGITSAKAGKVSVLVPVTKPVADPSKRTNELQDPENPLFIQPDLIEQLVMLEPTITDFIGEKPPKVADTQINNPAAPLTKGQKDAIRFEQAVEHKLNSPVANLLIKGLGAKNVLKVFGMGDLEKRVLNKEHKKTLEGKNLTIMSAFGSLMRMVNKIDALADNDQLDRAEVPVHFDYGFTSVGRMQMLGKDNPQASKLVREAIAPTRATIDLSSETSPEFGWFNLALAQALGIKIHKMSQEESARQVQELLSSGAVAPAVQMLQEWLDGQQDELTDAQVDLLRQALGKKASFVGLHALEEYARYLNAEADSRKAFTTSLYVEADGATNGPINAMQLITPGVFTQEWLENIRKGGLFPGQTGRTLNDHNMAEGSKDLYETTSDQLPKLLRGLKTQFAGDRDMVAQMEALEVLIDRFLPDAELQGDQLVFGRGISKNPLTITIYGSGARGIAGKLVHQITQAIYENLSDAAQRQQDNPELSNQMAQFPEAVDQVHAEELAAKFNKALSALSTDIAVKSRKKGFMLLDGKQPSEKVRRTKNDFENFSFQPHQLDNLTTNMLTLFVRPLREAVDTTVGKAVMDPNKGSATTLRQAVQVQGIVLEMLFKQRVEAKLKEKAKDPAWRSNDFLSKAELDEILQSLMSIAPLIQTEDQNFFIAGSSTSDLTDQEFGSDFAGDYRTPAMVYGPSDPGVSGIPSLIIGFGDGLMMQALSTMQDAVSKTLKVFDGIHLALDDLERGGKQANQAVFQSWMSNPLDALSKSYTTFLEGVGGIDLSQMDKATNQALTKALGLADYVPPEQDQPTSSLAEIQAALKSTGNTLARQAMEVEARHQALARINVSVDQMAGIGAAYQHEGTIGLSGMTDERLVEVLNELYVEELAKLTRTTEAATPEPETQTDTVVSQDITPELKSVGRELKSGVRVVSFTALKKLTRMLNIPQEQKALLGDILRPLVTKEFTIVFGSVEQLRQYSRDTGKQLHSRLDPHGTLKGFINFDEKTIYVINPNSETLVHELIHAATFEVLNTYYAKGKVGPEQVAAIKRLEELVKQFMTLDVSQEDAATQTAYLNALDAIESHRMKGNWAAALNEYMAWGLANSQLSKLQQKTKASPLVQLAQAVVDALKKLIWGRRQVAKPGDDMLSNLRFNANIIIQGQPSVLEKFQKTTLYHNEAYGQDQRLMRLNEVLGLRVIKHFEKSIIGPSEQMNREVLERKLRELAASDDMFVAVQNAGFKMTEQERSTFTMLTSILKTSMNLDPNAMARVQDIYAHVVKNLTPTTFLKDPQSTDPVERFYAQQKFMLLVGKMRVDRDAQRRTSLLPVFLGLAITNDEFRSVLAQIELPKSEQADGKTLDAKLENFGTWLMDNLTTMTSGEKNSPDVRAAIDALIDRIEQTAEERTTFMERVTGPTGNFIDKGNDVATEMMQLGAEKTMEWAKTVKEDPAAGRAKRLVAQAATGLAGVINKDTGSEVAEGLMSMMNKSGAWKPIQNLINDLVGRTMSNAAVFDMIKRVRNAVQQRRQQFREHLPEVLAKQFTRELSQEEWSGLFRGLGKTDIAALSQKYSVDEIMEIIQDPKTRDNFIAELEAQIEELNPSNSQMILDKAQQLATFMNTGVYGNFLLRNAHAVANLLGMPIKGKRTPADKQLIEAVDMLTTLYAYDGLPDTTHEMMVSLAQAEGKGMKFVTSYLMGQRVDELAKATQGAALENHYKGHMISEQTDQGSLIVADDGEYKRLVGLGYQRVADYFGSTLDRDTLKRGYYLAPVAAQAKFNQGIFQNVHQTAYGVNPNTGFSYDLTAGRITQPVLVERTTKRILNEKATEPLIPIFNRDGNVVAYERSVDPVQAAALERETHLGKVMGAWAGRQLEEAEAGKVNRTLIDRLHQMYRDDLKKDPRKQAEYVNLFDQKALLKDPVLKDAVSLLGGETLSHIESLFGEKEFMVRKDMLNDALGYRAASVRDIWTGTSNFPPHVLSEARKIIIGIAGKDAYKYLVNAESILQNVVTDARVAIVIRSMVVPLTNLLANVGQLWARGVPIVDVARGMPRKTAEVNTFIRTRLRADEAEAELLAAIAAKDTTSISRLRSEIQSIRDSHKRLSIWPLIEAGEFSSISDGTITHDDLALSNGRLHDYVEKLVSKLPDSVRTAGRYAVITRDTALFKGLQKTVEYGDFLSKAILYDHLTQKKGQSSADALAAITEEFVNYDRLPGRFRGALENYGLLWFYNFKIRSVKVALGMIRNNPVHALLSMMIPYPDMVGSVGLPVEDNLITLGLEGNLPWSMGPGMGLNSPLLNPWYNAVN